ncbi:MAG: hypothetical protein ACLP4W_22420 [Mycobacterium sp.]|uniref:hypothetical protein n=1 Tax=Mycobacterium sp. TaxID=1785 RepID=UPI003F981A5E
MYVALNPGRADAGDRAERAGGEARVKGRRAVDMAAEAQYEPHSFALATALLNTITLIARQPP